jgi:hypothetical protein
MTRSYAHILPEIGVRRRAATYYDGKGGYVEAPAQDGPPSFPVACPACGSPLVDVVVGRSAAYDCGATYTEKPQIQNHTDIWWGICPATKAQNEENPA